MICGAGLLAEPPLSRRMVHCRAFGADRSQQLLRTGRGDGNCSFRLSIGRGAFNRRRRAGGSAGDVIRRPDRQPEQGLVRARRCRAARLRKRKGRPLTRPIVETPKGVRLYQNEHFERIRKACK